MYIKDMELISENKMVRLVEERGVAASPWKKEIDSIAMYIRRYIKDYCAKNGSGGKIRFSMPSKYTQLFYFLKELTINVEARPLNENTNSGGGWFGGNKKNRLSLKTLTRYKSGEVKFFNRDKKLYNSEIDIICFYNNEGKVWLNSILTSFYHEMNHAYDVWIRLYKGEGFDGYNRTSVKGNFGNKLAERYPIIGSCIYRLFSETELNVLIASVFGDLEGRDSKYENFQNDYKLTQAYFIYNRIKNNIEDEIANLSNEEANILWKEMQQNGIRLNLKKNNVSSFKHSFIVKTEHLLNDLIHGIGRVASLYYDKKYEETVNNNGKIIGNN